ncbi:histidine kinase [Haloarchaeobius sp. TZWWS8]|uniref:histidine kinase n=1 Tax=Haloarchaeobius sp. TZWWS8 TaxID=3446121 RepID=UPI003EBB7EB3
MSSETQTTATHAESTATDWQSGVVAGLVAGGVMTVILFVNSTPTIEMAIPALYGLSGLPAGIAIHLFHSVIFGLGFAALVRSGPLESATGSLASTVGVGAAYGAVIWLLGAAILMPIWLGAVGFHMAPPVPNIAVQKLVVHLLFGAVLGGVFHASN